MKERIALGFGNNVDYEIIWDSRVIENMVIRYGIRNEELDISRVVTNERDLVISIVSFLNAGVGGERTVSSSEILEQFSRNFEKRITLGGTGVRAAIAMRKLGYTSALHLVTVNDHVRRLIPHDSPYVCSNTHDSLYPHVIVQFGKGSGVRAGDIDIRANQANRIIYHRDDDNIAMSLNKGFSDLITGVKVLLLSGFNAMQDEALLLKRLESLTRIMEALPKDALILYEDAGYYEPKFRRMILQILEERKHIISLNEDELQEYVGRKLDSLNAFQIKEALEDLRRLIPKPVIVVHTRYWALAYGDEAFKLSKALKGGVTMATTRFYYGDEFTPDNYSEIEGLRANEGGAAFSNEVNRLLGNRVCCFPVAHVDLPNATTIGLGDAFVGGFLSALAT